jgi:hypothetical protein
MTLKEAMDLFDQHADVLKKVEIGNQMLNEGYEMRGECVIVDKTIMTIVDMTSEYALVLNEQTITDKCGATETSKKFLSKDYMINLNALKVQMAKVFKAMKIVRKENIVTFEGVETVNKYTYQYDLRNGLFVNWVHHHHSYPGVEDHNIKYGMNQRIIPLSEVQGLPICTRDHLRLTILKCENQGI